MMIKIS